MIGCTRSNLHVVASDKGLVVGRIQFEEDGDFIDCTKMGVGGKAIPPYIDKIENIRSDAEFILLVEKEAAYMRMAVSFFSICSLLRFPFRPLDFYSIFRFQRSNDFCFFYSLFIWICYRRIAFTTNTHALSLLPRDNPMLLPECSFLASPTSWKFQSLDWWIRIPTVSKFCLSTCLEAKIWVTIVPRWRPPILCGWDCVHPISTSTTFQSNAVWIWPKTISRLEKSCWRKISFKRIPSGWKNWKPWSRRKRRPRFRRSHRLVSNTSRKNIYHENSEREIGFDVHDSGIGSQWRSCDSG